MRQLVSSQSITLGENSTVLTWVACDGAGLLFTVSKNVCSPIKRGLLIYFRIFWTFSYYTTIQILLELILIH